MSYRRATAVIAAVIAVIGFALLVLPISVSDPTDSVNSSVSCGTGFSRSVDAEATDWGSALADVSTSYVQRCDHAVGTRRMVALPLVGVGALVLLFVLMTTKWSDLEDAKHLEQNDEQDEHNQHVNDVHR